VSAGQGVAVEIAVEGDMDGIHGGGDSN
jgi:hypothetical protein